MTELQILRNSLFDEISRIKRGKSDLEESLMVVKVANAITNTYNTEIKGFNSIVEAREKGMDAKDVKIFDDTEKEKLTHKE